MLSDRVDVSVSTFEWAVHIQGGRASAFIEGSDDRFGSPRRMESALP
jgi:hypothetical protein